MKVVVVGGGLGGVSAAVRAAELGASVVLVEAGARLGGTALFSGGGIHIWGAKSWEEYEAHCPKADPALARPMVENFDRYVDWLVATGAPGSYGTTTLRGLSLTKYQIGTGIAPPGKLRWFDYMGRRLAELGGTVLLSSRATGMLLDAGRVAGVTVVTPAGVRDLRAGAVVLATGGFQSDSRLLSEHVGPAAGDFVPRAVAHDVGDGLRLATSSGAVPTPSMGTIYGHLMPAPPCRISWTNYIDPILLSAFYAQHGVVLNVRGERFADEGAGELNGETINAAAHQPPGGLWVVLDDDLRRAHARYELPSNVLRPENLRYGWLLPYMRLAWRQGTAPAVLIDSLRFARRRGATVLEAPTLEALGDRLSTYGVDGAGAVATVREYNRRVRDGSMATAPVPRTGPAAPIQRAPFLAVKVAVGVSMTYGGVRIDERARALDAAGAPVPGVFAVPGTAGGVHELHYGGALAACGVYGMIAGEEAGQ